jgi:hypothetical protein
MTDDITHPTRQAIAAKDRSGKMTVSGKLKVALDAMLFEGSSRREAAAAAGMTDHSLREAFKKPHVKRYYNEGLEVLRTSQRAKNILALARVRDESPNGLAVVGSVKALEQLAEADDVGPGNSGASHSPGITIRILTAPSPQPTTIDVAPSRPAPPQIEQKPAKPTEPAFKPPRSW